jgi:cytoskeletal protein CcmA (bactofilin family)
MLSGDKGDVGSLPSGAGTGNVFSSLTSTTVAAGTVMKTVSTTSSTLFLEPTTITVDSSNNMTGIGTLSLSGGSITIRSDSGSPGYIDMYCEVNNLHYSRLQAQPHANYSGNITITLPATSGTLALLAQKANFTDVTASTLTVSGNISADTITVTDITATGSASTIGAVAFTSTAATVTGNLTVTGSVTASSLTVNGNISASTITVADITATGSASTIGAVAFTSTGAIVTGGLTVTGAVTASNITIVGSASTLGAITVTTSSVGINTAAVTSGTALEVTGNMRITTTGNGLIFPDGSKQTAAASAGIGIGKAIAMALVFG